MMHLITGWAAVAIAAFIILGTMFSRHGSKETMTSLPIGLAVLVIGLWQLDVIPLGEMLASVTGFRHH